MSSASSRTAPVPPSRERDVVGVLAHAAGACGTVDGEAARAHHGHVGKIVADVRAGVRREAELLAQRVPCGELVGDIEQHVRDLNRRARCSTAGAGLPVIHATTMPALPSRCMPTPSSAENAFDLVAEVVDVDARRR